MAHQAETEDPDTVAEHKGIACFERCCHILGRESQSVGQSWPQASELTWVQAQKAIWAHP